MQRRTMFIEVKELMASKLLMKYVWNSHIDCRPVII